MNNITLTPGMGLNTDELAVLHQHAAGQSVTHICRELDLTAPELKLIEQDIRHKLNAKSPMHMITRAFQCGILRVLCLILCFNVIMDLNDDAVRSRTRTRNETSRTMRGNRNDMA